ncbi:MAG: TRAP transporter substrate-binding protein DctP [Firmicutes bacterium]|nr:TRAP transporter substrate-binding protein DctP [Bacillota bacterium]
MKKCVWIVLLIVLSIAMLLGGCTNKQPTQSLLEEGEVPEEVSEEVPEEVFQLTYSDWGPEQIDVGQAAIRAIEMAEERSNGRIEITPYFSETLVKFEDAFSAVATGVTDMSMYVSTFSMGIHDLNLIFHRLFAEEAPDIRGLSRVYQELLKNVPEIQEEMEKTGVRWLNIYALVGSNLHTSNKLVKMPEDIRGIKIQSYGDVSLMVNNLGGAAIEVPPNDWYMGFERGLFEGQFMHWPGIESFKLLELINNHTMFGVGGMTSSGIGTLVNFETWNSLPPDIQEILADTFQLSTEDVIAGNIEQCERMLKEAEEKNNTIVYLTPEEIQLWGEHFTPVNEKWIEETEAKGWPARQAYDELIRLFREYK